MTNTDNLYQRVYHLPDRLERARSRVVGVKLRIEALGKDVRSSDIRSLASAERRVRALENEARQYNFHDLLGDDK